MISSVQLTARKRLKCTEKGRFGTCFFIFRSEGYGISVALIFVRKLIQRPPSQPSCTTHLHFVFVKKTQQEHPFLNLSKNIGIFTVKMCPIDILQSISLTVIGSILAWGRGERLFLFCSFSPHTQQQRKSFLQKDCSLYRVSDNRPARPDCSGTSEHCDKLR